MGEPFWIVGVTGRSGSGKSMVTKHYAKLGYPTVDGDALSREVTGPGSPALELLVQSFGPQILAEDGTLLRGKLAGIAFGSPADTEKLVSITHPYILDAMLLRAEKAREKGARLFFVDGAVIVGGPFEPYCDRLIVVTSGHKLALSRIILRDGISKTAAGARLSAQQPEELLVRAADYVIPNDASLASLERRADEVLRELLQEME